MGPDSIDKLVRRWYEGRITEEQLTEQLMGIEKYKLVDHLTDLFKRVPEATRFALTATYGYEDV